MGSDRIYIVGAHSTGKTTLMRELLQCFPDYVGIAETARRVLGGRVLKGILSSLPAADQFQSDIFFAQIAAEREALVQNPAGFIADRGFDNVVYAARNARILRNIFKTKDWPDYIASFTQPDCLVLFLRPSRVCLMEDGVREGVSWGEVKAMDGMIDYIMESEGIPRVSIADENLRSRFRTAEAAIRGAFR